MSHVIVVSKDERVFAAFIDELKNTGHTVLTCSTGQEALTALAESKIDVVVAAEELGDGSGSDCIKTVAQQFPLTNTVLMSSLPPEEFHEETEGLGVLMQVSRQPSSAEAKKMLDILSSINGLLAS